MKEEKKTKKATTTKKSPQEQKTNDSTPWINPVGGLGDTLVLSGVLKMVHDQTGKKFNLTRRTKYLSILKDHPAIAEHGNPPKGSEMLRSDYWSIEKLGPGTQRPFQILARYYGLKTPVEEKLFLPGGIEEDHFLNNFIPWKEKNVIIAPSSDSPRKMMHPMAWHILTDMLLRDGIQVFQVGRLQDMYIKGSYSLLGNTTVRQLIAVVSKASAVITTDSFIMHSAHLTGTPCVAIWGPTSHEVYGYPEQIHLTAHLDHCQMKNECLGPDFSQNYGTPCPLNEQHCMNTIKPEEMYQAVMNVI